MTPIDEARRFFDAIAGRYDRVYAPPVEGTRARMARIVGALAPRSRVLDLGVGTGRELPYLLDAGHAVTGLDLSEQMLARCARRARPVPLVKGDLWGALPFEARAFDAVLALHGTLAHPPGDDAIEPLAAEVRRVLTAGGLFVVEAPLPTFLDAAGPELVRLAPSRARFTDAATGRSIDAWFFDEASWRRAVGAHLSIIRTVEEGGELFLVASKT